MSKPQQPELHRSGTGATDPGECQGRGRGRRPPTRRRSRRPIPEDNLPGHHPEQEQDKPVTPK